MKYSSNTYLKDVNKYKLYLYNNDVESITVKKILDISNSFSLIEFGNVTKLIDNGYYIVEIIPFNSFYICRLFLDNNFNVIEEYYIVTKNNMIKDGIPTYDDLSLAYIKVNGNNKIYHKEKLNDDKDGYLENSLVQIKKLNLDIDALICKVKKVVFFGEGCN